MSYVCITCFSIRSHCDLENPLNDLKVCSKKYFFSSESLKTCDNIASNNLEMNFISFTIYHSKCKSQAKYFNLILLLSSNISLYIKHDICFSTKNILSKNVQVIFVDLPLPKTKPVSVGIVYRPPKDTNFLQFFAEFLTLETY